MRRNIFGRRAKRRPSQGRSSLKSKAPKQAGLFKVVGMVPFDSAKILFGRPKSEQGK